MACKFVQQVWLQCVVGFQTKTGMGKEERYVGHTSPPPFLSLPAPNYAQLHLSHKWAAVDISQGVRSSISCVYE